MGSSREGLLSQAEASSQLTGARELSPNRPRLAACGEWAQRNSKAVPARGAAG